MNRPDIDPADQMMRRLWLCLMGVLCIAAVVVECAKAGEIAYDLSPPLTSDRDSCGAKDEPITDSHHYLIRLYRCGPFVPLEFQLPADTDSVRFTVADGIVGWTQAWSVDNAGNISCGYLSHTWASPAVAAPPPPPPPPPPDTSSTGIMGRYYANMSRGGIAIESRRDSVNFHWGLGAPVPGCPADSFSADYTGFVTIATPGSYTFYVESEDGAMLFLDGTLGINKWQVQPVTEWSYTANLGIGDHRLQLLYFARIGNSQVTLRYSGPGITKRTIPRSALK